jgi:MinD superfamily P-loop ATPase
VLRIAIASGKGGTGKTTIATNLAVTMAESGAAVTYVDCDVEEPNGHIFLRPTISSTREVTTPVPEVEDSRCTYCGACGKACLFSAIVVLPSKVLTFPKLCHGCGACTLACPENAIREVPRRTGLVEEGDAGKVTFLHGKLDIGEAMAPPVIRAVLASAPARGTVVIDAPPGTSCPVIESVRTADVALLVTEPTPFGLWDLKLAVEMVRELGVPFGVALNRAGAGDDGVIDYCAEQGIPILLKIPNDRQIAHAYSRGLLAVSALPHLRPLFVELHEKLRQLSLEKAPRQSRGTASTRDSAPPSPLPTGPGGLPSELVRLGGASGPKELVVISGKGGTGKTSIVASFFALAKCATVADCDVDAADLHLVLAPEVLQSWPFSGGKTAAISRDRCTGCGICAEHCRFDAILAPAPGSGSSYEVSPLSCEGCGVCASVCPESAVSMAFALNGEWFVSETRHGGMVHARLGVAQENSGKLVSLVRREAKALAASKGSGLLICDGSPGIGCPVIASITGADMVLVVTEPTLSGLHDLKRVSELCGQLDVETGVCINKADINPEVAALIESEAASRGIPILGRIRYDESVTAAQIRQRAVVEIGDGPAAEDIRTLWDRVNEKLASSGGPRQNIKAPSSSAGGPTTTKERFQA